ncbi:MAG: ABC transporter permease subunit, partial [Leptospiraceae bacterium]|nr:ABC transporter permease subunit [Leptospiraceae bacterium]
MNIPIYYPKKVKSFLLVYVLIYLSAIVLIPFVALFTNSFQLSWTEIIKILFHERCISAYKVSFFCSFLAALINTVFGFIIAFSLVKFDFVGKKFFDSIVDFPFALPTAVAGLAYVDLYSKTGLFGRLTGLPLAYTKAGIVLVLCFVSLPFAVRTIQPVLQEMDIELEQAAISLGANSFQILRYVIIPYI